MPVGTIDNPLHFGFVLSGESGALPGSTFLLQPGEYLAPVAGAWQCALSGTALAPYTFKGQPGVRIGPITIAGQYTIWEDCEFAYTGWADRYSPIPGSNVPGPFGWAQLICYGKGTIIRRCTLHDLANVDWGVGASDSVIEDCVIYNIGWDASDRGHGHGAYIQNDNAGPKVMRRCVSVLAYATPGKVYGVNAPLQDVTIEDCVFAFGKELYTYVRSDGGVANDITIQNLYTFGVQWDHSCFASGGGPLVVDGGVIVSDVDWYAYDGFRNWQLGASVRNLQIVGLRAVSYWPGTALAGWIDNSTYHVLPGSVENAPFVAYGGSAYSSLAAWQAATGNDAHSTYSTTPPSSPRVETIARADGSTIVVVYNWQQAPTVPAPMAGHYQNALHVAESMDVTDTLPMGGWTTATPIGAAAPIAAWDNRFGVFVVT